MNCLDGKPLPIYGDGGQVRDWLFVDDHCHAIRSVLQRGKVGQVYNIGGDSELKNIDVVMAICDTVDRVRPNLPHSPCKSLIKYVTDRPGHDRRYAIDFTKIHKQLGWSPSLSFQEGISQTVEWYLNNPDWVENVTSGGYRRTRLGLSNAE